MKLPRNINGDDLAYLLKRFGYSVDHQTGSHQRLSAIIAGKPHALTIPRHKPLRIGTLHQILKDLAKHQGISLEQVIQELFG